MAAAYLALPPLVGSSCTTAKHHQQSNGYDNNAMQVDGLTRLMLDAGRKGSGEGEEETSPKRRGNRRDTWAPGLTGV